MLETETMNADEGFRVAPANSAQQAAATDVLSVTTGSAIQRDL
jgi:hypothetical protein